MLKVRRYSKTGIRVQLASQKEQKNKKKRQAFKPGIPAKESLRHTAQPHMCHHSCLPITSGTKLWRWGDPKLQYCRRGQQKAALGRADKRSQQSCRAHHGRKPITQDVVTAQWTTDSGHHLESVCDALTIAAFSATESRLGKLAKEPYKKVKKWSVRRLPPFRKIV